MIGNKYEFVGQREKVSVINVQIRYLGGKYDNIDEWIGKVFEKTVTLCLIKVKVLI
ncbi:MAG: hypothetical protein LBF27_34740 [Sphingobacterium sp.]|jgi:hypothetical protein|nr:hypothetical protein [Sphingobacterium sp.]